MKARERQSIFTGILILFSLFLFGPESRANVKAAHTPPSGTTAQPSDGRHLSAPTSPFWQSSLWEALPLDALRDPNPSPLLDAYGRHGWKPFFITGRFELSEAGKQFVKRLGALGSEAINPGPYRIEALNNSLKKLDQQRMALMNLDPEFKDSLADFSEGSQSGLFCEASHPGPPTATDHSQAAAAAAMKDKTERYKEAFRAASEADILLTSSLIRFAKEMNPYARDTQAKFFDGAISFDEFLKAVEPPSVQYRALVEAHARYRQLASQGGQPTIREGGLSPGASGENVRDLQKRLQQEGFYGGKLTGVYDPQTLEAVKSFQTAHGLDPDGKIGPGTRSWLNVTYAEKARMVEHGLANCRQSATRQYDRYVRINIPQFLLEYHKGGEVQATHRVIVGKASGKKIKRQGRMVGENHTPPLASAIQQVIVNPRWYVTPRIWQELVDEAGGDSSYFARNGYVHLSSSFPSGAPRIFMRPGPKNPLGRVKFEFPNAYAVFLHDTPKRHLFQRSRRDFSHGCIRVDKALELAELILKEDENPAASRVQSIGVGEQQTFFRLTNPLPIVIEYQPVFANAKGQVLFVGDPYRWFNETDEKERT